MQVKASSIFSTPASKNTQQYTTHPMKQLNKEQLIQQLQQSLKRQYLQKSTSDMLEKALQQVVQKKDEEIKFLRQENTYLTESKAEYARKIDQIKQSYQQKIQKLRQQINQSKNMKQFFNIEKQRIKLQYDQIISDLERQLLQKQQKISSLQGKIHKLTIQKLETQGDQTIKLGLPNQISRMSNLSSVNMLNGNNMSASLYRNQNGIGQHASFDLCSEASLFGQLGNSTVKYSKQINYPILQDGGRNGRSMAAMNFSRIYQNKQNMYSNHGTIKNQNKLNTSNLKHSKLNVSQGKASMKKQEIKMRMREIKAKQRQLQQQSQLQFSSLANSNNILIDKSNTKRVNKTYLV